MEYKHLVQYYETDKMGITHHSNYIRWMEEARIQYLAEAGCECFRDAVKDSYVMALYQDILFGG